MFGAKPFGTGNASFGGATSTPFGADFGQTANINGTTLKFNPPTSQDTMLKNRVSRNIYTRHQCITAMKEYQSKSLEELRVEDYLANRKGKQTATAFATPSASGGFSLLQNSNMAFNPTPASTGTSLFGQQPQQQTSSLFGQNKPLFGASTATGTGTSGFSGFGTTTSTSSLFGQPTQNKPLFGATPSTQASGFGGTSTGFGGFGGTSTGFGQTSAAGTSLFNSKPAFGTTTTAASGFGTPGSYLFAKPTTGPSLFGTTSQPSTFGTSGGFSFGTTPGIGTSTGVFGAKPTTFGNTSTFNLGQTSAFNLNKPFGTSTGISGFGTSTGFGVGTGFPQGGASTTLSTAAPQTAPVPKEVLIKQQLMAVASATCPPVRKSSENKDAPKVQEKNPSRDSTSLESNDWRTKFEEKDKELNCLNQQMKLLAQELGETSGKILTEAARELNIKEQKSKEQMESLKESESNLESVKKVVFGVPKVKEKDHDLEKTITRIQDLHNELSIKEQKNKEQMERLKELESSHESVKNAVFEKVKEKDHDLEKTITRIQDLHKSEQACLELKNIIFDEELKRTIFKIKLDEDQRSTENARKMFENLKKVWKIINEERNVILTTILGKEILEPSVNDALQRLKVFKRNQNELQEVLMAVSETDDPVTSKQAIEKVQELKSTEKAQYETIQKQSENLRRLETEISQMEKRYGSMKRDKEDVEQRLTNEIERLSEVAGAKLTNENPNITDLSDPNRPIKIAEQYSELYDNAWTDIFEKLTEKYKVSEKEAIQMLLHILEGGPKEETTKGKKQEIAQILSSDEIIVMQKFFDNPKQAVDNKTLKSVLEKIGVSETDMKNMKNLLKITVDGTCHFVEQHVWEKRSEIQAQDDVHLEIAKPYLKKCVRICWLMVAQDPPVFLKTLDKKDNKFDKDLYREFTSSGKKMDHVVWPAILLHEGGPLLKKGVAQPK